MMTQLATATAFISQQSFSGFRPMGPQTSNASTQFQENSRISGGIFANQQQPSQFSNTTFSQYQLYPATSSTTQSK